MAITVFSYAGTLRMNVLSDKAVLSNPAKLTEKFVEEFEEMYKCVKNGPVLAPDGSAAKRKYF